MKATLLAVPIVICILCTGCTLGHNLAHTTIIQPIQYCSHLDEVLERRRFRKLAQSELERERCAARAETDEYSCPPFSMDHERGFEDGFVDYLVYGGTGTPPPLPPRRYWWSDCENVNGCNAIQEWFAGFEHGAAVAKASGCRECVTVPLSDALSRDTLPLYPGEWIETVDSETAVSLPDETDRLRPDDSRDDIRELSAPPGSIESIGPGELPPAILSPQSQLPQPIIIDPSRGMETSDLSGVETPRASVFDLRLAFAIEDSDASMETSTFERHFSATPLNGAVGSPDGTSRAVMRAEPSHTPQSTVPAPKRITAPRRMTSLMREDANGDVTVVTEDVSPSRSPFTVEQAAPALNHSAPSPQTVRSR